MCGPKGYGFSAVLVIIRVSILTDFCHFGHKYGFCTLALIWVCFYEEATFHHCRKENQQKPFTNSVYGNSTLV